jgi:hypothetical protein
MQENDSLKTAPTQVATDSLSAKDILKMVFVCSDSLTDDEILQQIRTVLVSSVATHINSIAAASKLISSAAGAFVQRFCSDFESLDERDREDASLVILSRLKEYAAVQRRGRPKGAKAQDTQERISLAAALQFLGCSRMGMVPFLNPMQNQRKAGKDAVDKFLKRHATSINREYTDMNQALASQLVKGSLTKELAERIVKSS